MSPSPQLTFADLEQLLQQQLNCTSEEFREVWQGGYERCEQQQQLLQQQQQQQQQREGPAAIGSQQQQVAVMYIQQLEDQINAPLGTHEAAAAAAAAAAAGDDATAETHAAEGDDRTDAGIKRRQNIIDPFAGPPEELAPPNQMHLVPALQGKP